MGTLPVQYFLLSAGRGQEASDQGGVIITICQWLLLSAAFGLGSLRRTQNPTDLL